MLWGLIQSRPCPASLLDSVNCHCHCNRVWFELLCTLILFEICTPSLSSPVEEGSSGWHIGIPWGKPLDALLICLKIDLIFENCLLWWPVCVISDECWLSHLHFPVHNWSCTEIWFRSEKIVVTKVYHSVMVLYTGATMAFYNIRISTRSIWRIIQFLRWFC